MLIILSGLISSYTAKKLRGGGHPPTSNTTSDQYSAMESECNPRKHRYDLSMSKRTRKPLRFVENDNKKFVEVGSDEGKTSVMISTNILNEEAVDHTSLKELIIIGEEEVDVDAISGEAAEQMIVEHEETREKEGKGSISLGHHFTVTTPNNEEEKQFQIVTVQHGGSMEGVKSGKMLSRYMKVFTHVIKLKKDRRYGCSHKKPVRSSLCNVTQI
ncbi:hypothetical protein FRX31_018234 [Thalictrum thalictroides]|uniref:Uncharacterized protein n=1 Tax=Thalictrum thalictroides TaxID=46969 RepID=A0A7J6W473_THATH|nr:hypothetical protein FRX31_018234 [Thalictrum thalictroides]